MAREAGEEEQVVRHWLGLAVESSVPWPTEDTTVTFQGHEIVLRAATDKTAPSVEIEFEAPLSPRTAHLLLRRFLSSLAWAEGHGVREEFSIGGSRRVGFGRSQPGMVLTSHFRADYLPEPDDPKARLALALYREALGLNSDPYRFLAFFKVINIGYSTGPKQCEWIRSALPQITDHQAKQRLQELVAAEPDVAQYLYDSGRCAVAHAFSEPLVDPDDPEDHRRLSSDLPVVRALAERFIEHELGVKSRHAIWQEHLYELDGFREMLGPEVVGVLKAGGAPDRSLLPCLPNLSVRLGDHDSFPSFENLEPELVEPHEGCLLVVLRSTSAPVRLALTLHFAKERLGFDPTGDIEIRDEGSAAVVNAAIDRAKLIGGMVMNGQLEVWQTDPERLLGRCDPCIPVNIDPRATNDNLRRMIAELEAELVRRQGAA